MELKAFLSGKLIAIEDVPDDVFSARILGDGVAIIPENQQVTSPMNGDGFVLHVKAGQKVKAGDLLISFSKDKIRAAGYNDITMLVIANLGEAKRVKFVPVTAVKSGEVIAEIEI